ncbi:25295_t:CDS:2, partial [Gigaspora rosea]
FPSKSLLNDELVSLKLAAYLRSQKFQINPIMVKNYVEQQIIPQLGIESVQQISLRTARRWDDLEEARAMMVLGSRHDGYWDAKKLIIQ